MLAAPATTGKHSGGVSHSYRTWGAAGRALVNGSARVDVMTEIDRYRAEILRIAAEYGASNLRISGADAGPGADIDVLVDVAPDSSLFDLVDMGRELGALLDRKVDVYAASSLSPRLLEGLLADAWPLR
jgi:uncharacterized protein